MRQLAGTNADVQAMIAAALRGELSEAQAEQLARMGPEVTKLVLLAAARRIAEQNARISELQAKATKATKIDPSTPSGQRPVYASRVPPSARASPAQSPVIREAAGRSRTTSIAARAIASTVVRTAAGP